MTKDVTFNDFILNFNSGELTKVSKKKGNEVIRLSPQTAKLLQLLIGNYPEIVSKEEIKSILWPDVQVDFDNSLHFCVRQIRIAFEDNVLNPKYIETIPRRGYKWLVEVQATKKRNKTNIKWIVVTTLIIATFISVSHYFANNQPEVETIAIENQTNIKLAIMPLQPSDSLNLFYGNTIAYDLFELLWNTNKVEVIGPTTTQNINQEKVYAFLEDSGADYIVNGKFSGRKDKSELLVEIIRDRDKAHIWVASYNFNLPFIRSNYK